MKKSRAYYGDLRLWRTARLPEPEYPRGAVQIYEGIDQVSRQVVPGSSNYGTKMIVHTIFDPYYDAAGKATRSTFRSAVDEMNAALIVRGDSLAPLCWFEDVTASSVNTTVSSILGAVVTTAVNPHGFSINEYVLVRRLGSGLYTLAKITSLPAANKITLENVDHSVANGDNVFRVDRFWKNMVVDAMAGCGLDKEKGHWNDDAQYKFDGGAVALDRYSRQTINLDSDAGL